MAPKTKEQRIMDLAAELANLNKLFVAKFGEMEAAKLSGRAPVMRVDIDYTVRGKKDETKAPVEETIVGKPVKLAGEVVLVNTTLGLTINLGDYESARVNASITYPCGKEEVDKTFDECWKRVEAQVQKEAKGIKDTTGVHSR